MPIPHLPAPDEYLARLGALARERGMGGWFTQHARLITLDTPQASGLPDTLVVERFHGREGVNELFCFDIEALSLSTHLDLADFIGEELTLRVLQADGRYRAWHGYCTEMAWLGADGGVARYRLRLEPFLAFLRLRRDSYIFQDKNAQEIVTALLGDYPAAHFRFDITQALAPRPVCTQYRESDLDFFTRLLASEGLSWRFEHEQDAAHGSASVAGERSEGFRMPGATAAQGSAPQAEIGTHAKHQLVIFDIHAPAPPMPGGADLRFHGVRATEARDAIDRFSALYFWSKEEYEQREIPGYLQGRDAPDTTPEGQGSMRWHLARERLSYTFLLYSGGESIDKVKSAFTEALDSIEEHLEGDFAVIDEFDLAIQDSYVEALWLFSLTKLLGFGDEQIERVANFYAADETNDGADELFEIILARLGRKSFPAEGVIHEDPYELLLHCIKAAPGERPALMTQFLKRWFKGQKECDWWGSHVPRKGTTVLDTGFFGYWAFEAALVTYLWDIDDTSYRDLPHYPKDLVDYARQHVPLGDPSTGPVRLRCEANHPCPKEGYWFTPAKASSRRHFKQGEIMPDLGSAWGSTIWQWDDQQAP